MRTLVLDKNKRPLMPCYNARARKLLAGGKAAVFRRYPFTIILKQRACGHTQPLSLNVDPGSKTTRMALVAEFNQGHTCIFSVHIEHRGHRIKKALDRRRAHRQSKRSRKTRYRAPRFLNRTQPQGWLPPSLMSRVHNINTWTKKLIKASPIDSAHVETVRFDPQLMANPKIKGVEYQQGTLMDWELREYLLVRHRHICAYCHGLTGDALLEKEHIIPRSLGGTNQLSNLVIACRTCNQHKGHLLPAVWGEECGTRKNNIDQQRSRSMAKIRLDVRPSLREAVTATRYAVGRVIKDRIANTQFWSGGRTKKNRTDQHYPKAHWIDAAYVGETGHQVTLEHPDVLTVSAKGHGSRQMCRMDKYGFPRTSAKANRSVKGFKTGDRVMLTSLKAKNKVSTKDEWPSEVTVFLISPQTKPLSKALATNIVVSNIVVMATVIQHQPDSPPEEK